MFIESLHSGSPKPRKTSRKKKEKVLANLAFQHIYLLYQWADCDVAIYVTRNTFGKMSGNNSEPVHSKLWAHISTPSHTLRYAIQVVALGKKD
ncbi:unnamed protein product, partial [Mesorhabditis spiculigera]